MPARPTCACSDCSGRACRPGCRVGSWLIDARSLLRAFGHLPGLLQPKDLFSNEALQLAIKCGPLAIIKGDLERNDLVARPVLSELSEVTAVDFEGGVEPFNTTLPGACGDTPGLQGC